MPHNNPTQPTKTSQTFAPTYAALVRLIKKEIEQGLKDIRYRQVLIYWRMGRFIRQYILHGADRAKYGERLYQHLEKEIPFKADTLQRTVQFFKEFPKEFSIQATLPKLGWGHYRALMGIEDLNQRKILQVKAVQENLNVRQLQHLVSKENSDGAAHSLSKPKTVHKKFKLSPEGIPQLPIERGSLSAYQVMTPVSLQTPPGFIVVDCGFEEWFEIPGFPKNKFKAGDIIESLKTEAEHFRIKKSSQPKTNLYTFKAMLERVVDADTFIFHVDCGFHLWSRQRLRLRHINCPELSTPEGKKAKRFIEETIKDCEFCIIKTYSSDKYDRYLVDIFFLPNEKDSARVLTDGKLLNQELLNAGLAEIW